MGQPNPNFTLRLPDHLRRSIKDAANRFGLKEADIARMLIARGVGSLRKDRIVLYANAMQKGAA